MSLLPLVGGLKAVIEGSAGLGPMATQIPPLDQAQTLPVILIQCIDARELESLNGLSEMAWSVMQVSVSDRLYDSAFQYRGQITAALASFTGNALGNLNLERATDFRYRELYLEDTEVWQLILRCQVFWTLS